MVEEAVERAADAATKADAAGDSATEKAGIADAAAVAANGAASAANAAAQAANDGEEERKSAELLRAEADQKRTRQQAANDAQQAKNNADQDANNKAAQGLVWVELSEDQLGPDRVPNIEGEFGKLYFAPSENPSESDTAVEWMWKPGGDGTGRWERVGTSEVIPPAPIGTDKIDQIHDGEQLSGKGVMSEADLAYFFTLINGDRETHESEQNVRDVAQDDAIKEAKKAGEDAAEALNGYKETQSETDRAQNEAIEKAQETANAAKNAIPPTVTGEAGGILPAFPSEGGPFYPTAEGGELRGWQLIPIFDTTQPGLVPAAPEG
ncbi:hypothetical protein EVA_10924, partial [gut metagenome]